MERPTGCVKVAMVALAFVLVVEGNVEVNDVALDERSGVGNTCARRKSSVLLLEGEERRGEDAPWQITSFTLVHTERGKL
jgi:hypothetical protein